MHPRIDGWTLTVIAVATRKFETFNVKAHLPELAAEEAIRVAITRGPGYRVHIVPDGRTYYHVSPETGLVERVQALDQAG